MLRVFPGVLTLNAGALAALNNDSCAFLVREKRRFKKILLIDDAIGSGATINETALKLKDQAVANYIVGLAITGSFKGFEVIQEV